jgi:hypothetical protein
MNEIDLDAHYLTSRSHPVCDTCNVGFATEVEYAEVRDYGTYFVVFFQGSCRLLRQIA